jgi:hypothetical protein
MNTYYVLYGVVITLQTNGTIKYPFFALPCIEETIHVYRPLTTTKDDLCITVHLPPIPYTDALASYSSDCSFFFDNLGFRFNSNLGLYC